MNWIDNADSYICPACGQEVSSPANVNFTCPKCGFVAKKDKPVVSKAMSEQRLIDANALTKQLESIISDYASNGTFPNGYDINSALDSLVDAPTIDPETLPIVRELRKKLERVTEERDSALKQLSDISDCDTCKHTGCIPRGGRGKCKWEWNVGAGGHS